MLTLNNVATQDTYVDAAKLEQDTADTCTYVVANASVFARFRPIPHSGGADMPYGDEVLLTPQANTVHNISGAQFRSAVAGKPAAVIAQLTGPIDPQIAAGTPFTQSISASGVLGLSGFGTVRKNTTKDVVSTAAETDLFNGEITLPAGAMGTGGFVRLTAEGDFFCNAALTPTITLRLKLGGAITVWAATTGALPNGAARANWCLDATILNDGAANAQRLIGQIGSTGRNANPASVGEGGMGGSASEINASLGGSGARDTTVAQLFEFTAQWSVANALHSMRLFRAALLWFNAAA